MTERPQPKLLSTQDWESLIDDFQHCGARRDRWTAAHPIPSILDAALSSLLKKDFPLKIPLIIFLEEFSRTFFTDPIHLDRLVEAMRAVVQSPVDNVGITFQLKEQVMVSTTSILISINAFEDFDVRFLESVVELLLAVVNRPNHGFDRHTRAIACECLREFEKSYPCLLSDIAVHLWTLCQSERTHASQSYLLLFTTVVYNIVDQKLGVSILNTSAPLVPFNVPQWMPPGSGSKDGPGSNYKELRRAVAFLLEWPQVLTPLGLLEFMGMVMPVAAALELQAPMLKVQFFGMMYSFNPMLCHVVLMMYLYFVDAFDEQEVEIMRRLALVLREMQQSLVFRLLSAHWLIGLLNKLVPNGEIGRRKSIAEMGSMFYPSVFDPLALKALKLDLLAFCSVCLDALGPESLNKDVDDKNFHVKLFKDGLVSVSGLKWLPPWSTETAVAFRTFHKFLIGASSHADSDPSNTKVLLGSTIFIALKEMLVDMMLEFQRLVPVIVYFVNRFLSCRKHCWLGDCLLQTVDKKFLARARVDYTLVSYFPMFDRIAANDTIPPRGLLELLTKFMVFIVENHGPDTAVKSWSRGSKVLDICRTMLTHHHSSRLFIWLSHLLAFTCLYFPDLEVRDLARIYLRLLISVPGVKVRGILKLGGQTLGISPSSRSESFFSIQSPRHYIDLTKSRNISAYIHLERMRPLLVKQSWSLSLSTLAVHSNKSGFSDGIRDPEVSLDESEHDSKHHSETPPTIERIDKPQVPLRVMDSKVSEILDMLRRHFSCIPDSRHVPGLKVKIPCTLRFESEPFDRIWGVESPRSGLHGVDALPAIYATVLKFSSSAPYGSIPSCHIPFLVGQPSETDKGSSHTDSLDIVPVGIDSREEEAYQAPITIELEPHEPTPGLVDVLIETNGENGQIISGMLQSVTVGIEDLFLKSVAPSDVTEDALPAYYSDLFNALWNACGASSNIGREIFLLRGGKGVAAINGTRSVKLLEVSVNSMVHAIEVYLAPFVVSVIGEHLIDMVKDGGVIQDVMWKEVVPDILDGSASSMELDRGPLRLTYIGDEDEKEKQLNTMKRNLGIFHILVFLPPRFHLLFEMEVSDISTLVRIRTDHWPCLAYIDDYLEALLMRQEKVNQQ